MTQKIPPGAAGQDLKIGDAAHRLDLRRNKFPIDQIVEKICQIVGALVSEINVVGMFPHIAPK
jgi:hypothetical protein